jgi:hypothetical protein
MDKVDLNDQILNSFDDSEKALLIVTVQRQDKYSLIANFLCSSNSYNMFPICDIFSPISGERLNISSAK